MEVMLRHQRRLSSFKRHGEAIKAMENHDHCLESLDQHMERKERVVRETFKKCIKWRGANVID